jgi:hypothetical protein
MTRDRMAHFAKRSRLEQDSEGLISLDEIVRRSIPEVSFF